MDMSHAHGIPYRLPYRIPYGIPYGTPYGIACGIPHGIAYGIPYGILLEEKCPHTLLPRGHISALHAHAHIMGFFTTPASL